MSDTYSISQNSHGLGISYQYQKIPNTVIVIFYYSCHHLQTFHGNKLGHYKRGKIYVCARKLILRIFLWTTDTIIFPSNTIPFHLVVVLYLMPAYSRIDKICTQTNRAMNFQLYLVMI